METQSTEMVLDMSQITVSNITYQPGQCVHTKNFHLQNKVLNKLS